MVGIMCKDTQYEEDSQVNETGILRAEGDEKSQG